ncbi:MAG: folate-binding protein YgfZ [Polyangiaceae bacterium]|nr:folate-binding protein YgfZ [Polyangiaceae bacterium]
MPEKSFAAALDAVATGALVRRDAARSTLVVTGADRQSWLNGLVTCDLKPLRAGEGAYGLSVGKTGRVQADLWVALGAERLLVGLPRERVDTVRALFEHHLIMEDVELAEDAALGWLFAFGPGSARLLALAGSDLAAAVRARYGDLEACLCVGDGPALDALAAAARALPGVVEASEAAWERVRIEHLLPRWGVDFGEVYAQEAALERLAVSFQKGCYLGQEAVFMLEKRGQASRRLVQLAVTGSEPVAVGAPIVASDGDPVGTVSSACAAGARWLALGTVKRRSAGAGSSVTVAGRPAEVSVGLDPSAL